jgi:tetratricopeptide (TPR) repeat protein
MFERRFTADPSSAASYLNFAQCNMFLGRWDPARTALLRLTTLKPDYVPGFRYLGDVYSQMDSLTAARAAYTNVTKIAVGQEEKYANDLASAYGGIGIAFLLEKKYPQAIEALTSSIKYKDDNPQTRLWRAQGYALANRRDEAAKEFKVVLKLDPKNKDAKKGLESLGQ